MREKSLVRIVETELENFKNVNYGNIKFVNYSNAEYRAELKESDINGIYGQNGSGKTAIIEAFDILQHIMSGNTISYDEYEGMFNDDKLMKIYTVFYIECGEKKYKARYELILKQNIEEKKIQISSENLIYWQRGGSWKKERNALFCKMFQRILYQRMRVQYLKYVFLSLCKILRCFVHKKMYLYFLMMQ